MKRINSRIETVQLFLRSFDTGKLSIETKLPIHCTRDSWKSTLEFLFQFVRSRRTLHGTSASYSRFSRFEPRVIRFLFFRAPFVSSSRFLLKRNEGGHPSPPFFPPYSICTTYTQFHAIRVVDTVAWNANSQALWLSTSYVSSIISLEYRPSSYIALAPDYAYISITRIGPTRKIKPLVDFTDRDFVNCPRSK